MTKTESFLMLAGVFREKYTDEVVVHIVDGLLKDVTDDELERACKDASLSCKFMPSVSELKENVMDWRAQHPPARKRSPPMTKDKWWAICVRMDKQEMGDMTDEQYEKFKAEYLAETGEVWWPPGWNPKEEWNEDGTQKGLEELYHANKAV